MTLVRCRCGTLTDYGLTCVRCSMEMWIIEDDDSDSKDTAKTEDEEED